MNEPTPNLDDLPAAVPAQSRRGRLPLVWILPALVVLVGAFVVIYEKLSQGTTIEIRFLNAEGLEAGKTKVRYKDVDIGEVSDIHVGKERKDVIVTAEIHPDAKQYLVADTRFWVVRPRVSGAGISGLGTLVSGEYISVDVGTSTERRDRFIGLEVPPIVTSDLPGREFVLHADDLGSLGIGSEVFFRHISAGQVVGYTLDPDGSGVTVKVFVNAPFDAFVNASTRFWQASGIDMSISSDGVRVRTESLTSILEGGVTFRSLPGGATTPVAGDTEFTLYPDEVRAMRPIETEIRPFVLFFKGSLRGLSAGAPVDLQGITVGEVKSVNVDYDAAAGLLRFPVEIELYPERLRGTGRGAASRTAKPGADSESVSPALLDALVAHGLRAELKTGNLLTGQKFVALAMYEKPATAKIDWAQKPAVLPTMPGGLDEIQDSIGSIARKLDKVPFDQISYRLQSTLSTLEQTLQSADHLLQNVDSNVAPEIQATLAEARAAMQNAKQLLSQDAPLRSDLGTTLLQVSRAAQSMNALLEYLQRHPESLLRGKPGDQP